MADQSIRRRISVVRAADVVGYGAFGDAGPISSDYDFSTPIHGIAMLQHFCEASGRCPSDYIGFRSKIVFAKPGSEIGKTTREAVGLNRPDLKSARALYLDSLKGMRELAESNLTGNANAMTFLKKAILPSSPYSLMAATYLEDFDFS